MDGKRTFYQMHEAYYAKRIGQENPEIMFGVTGGELHGEMAMKWYDLNGLTPRLEAFSDAWHTLGTFQDILQAMAGKYECNMTPEDFVALLLKYGFEDITQYEDEYAQNKEINAEIRKHKGAIRHLESRLE